MIKNRKVKFNKNIFTTVTELKNMNEWHVERRKEKLYF